MTQSPLDPSLKETPYALQKHLGFHLTHWDTDFAQLELPIEHYLMNRAGIPHGGIYATLLDTVMGYAGCFTGSSEQKRLALTLSLTTNFLSRPKGKLLIAKGHRTGGGSSTFFAESTILDETGEVIARGSGAFKYRRSA
ncbi:PaaI family thioesterase [Shimia litoralis]|uniref:PaaI family thioesterase n=1 Tax=Shimia litoralis TaxID=420403 RepID=A0A4U7N0R8_9RHOB|nr:PaaI family thioesterase [Shimia litoralis]TKZ19225.1 PaaI family thioesterase [Shimia litoralis]